MTSLPLWIQLLVRVLETGGGKGWMQGLSLPHGRKRLCSSCLSPPQARPVDTFSAEGHKGVFQSSCVQCTQVRKLCPKCEKTDYSREKNNNPTKTRTATRTMLLRMLFVMCCVIEHTFWNRLAIPFHSLLLFPIPQVSLKVSSKVTLFMNFSNWNALLRIVILLLCDLVWKAACTKLKRSLWIKAVRLDTEVYNEH